MLGISVTGDAILGYVITITDATVGDRIKVTRTDVSGHYPVTAVRGLNVVSPSGATVIETDYEAPFNTELHFTVDAYDISDLDTPTASATFGPIDTVVPEGFAIITDPLDATQRVSFGVVDLDDWEYSTRVLGRHQVIGRSNSVTKTDVESGREGSMVLTNLEQFEIDWDDTGPYLPYTVVNHENWRTVFSSGRTLLFRNTWYESGFDDLYFKALTRKASRLGAVGAQGGQPWMSYTITYEEQDRPSTGLDVLGLGNWLVVRESNSNWAEVLADHTDWASVLVNPDL